MSVGIALGRVCGGYVGLGTGLSVGSGETIGSGAGALDGLGDGRVSPSVGGGATHPRDVGGCVGRGGGGGTNTSSVGAAVGSGSTHRS